MRIMGLKLICTVDVIKASEILCFPVDKSFKYRSTLKEMGSVYMVIDYVLN